MAEESQRVTALSAGQLRRLMARLGERQATAPGIPRAPRGGPQPLSFTQEGLWFLERLGTGGAVYHIPAAVRLRGPLVAGALEQALSAVAQRHEALRTTFGEQDGVPVQTVHAAVRLAMPRVDLSGLPSAQRNSELARITREEASRPFDLERGPLLRSALVRLGHGEHSLALTLHHIVADGWSLGVLIREVAALYAGFSTGSPARLPELPVQAVDYAVWERERLHGQILEDELDFWRRRLDGLPPLELQGGRPRSAAPGFRGAQAHLDLPGEPAGALEALASRERATPFMALLALFEALLLRYTGQCDFGVGTPVANRPHSEVEGVIGLFVNTVVLRADLSGEPGFAELLRRTRDAAVEAFAHELLPFDKLAAVLRPEREAGRNPLFQVMFTLQNQPWPELRIGEVDLEVMEVDTGTARADLTLTWRPRQGGLAGTLEYSAHLFERAGAERLLGHMAELLRGALADPEQSIRELPLFAAAERRQILGAWRGSAVPYPREATVHELFDQQAAMAGDRFAVEAGDLRLTYAELAARANQLAHRLRGLGIGPESLVGVALPRSPEMVVGLLGILKAGGAYLPLDPSHPRERLAALTAEARPQAVVTLEPLLDRLPGGIPAVCLDRDRAALAAEPATAFASGATAGNLIYVLYTSGSTGRPKGVAVPHRGVVRLVRGAGFARLDDSQAFLQLAPLAFDASTLEIWGPLCNGGRLVLAPPEPPSLAEIGRLLSRHRVTALWLTAGLFHQMVDEGIAGLAGLSQLLAGGDVLSPVHVFRALAALPGCALVNGYGPTENTTFTCCQPLAPGAPADAAVPIGRPIANTTVAVLDRDGRPVPVGVPGELYASGDGLARGYLGRPDLTAERFLPSPLAGAEDPSGARLYRTGDLVRWRPDGALDFLGRVDRQVKIRGFRIEPGEIEAALAAHPGVAECAVVAQGGGGEDHRLVAWFTAHGAPPAPAELRAWLAARLPAYMVPAAFAPLAALPLNPSGKVDRRGLARRPPPAAGSLGAGPETPLERRIAAVWSGLLGQRRIGRDDDFFALGGHSLLATRVVSRLREELGIEIPLVAVFENPTPATFAAFIERHAGAAPGDGPIPGASGGEAPLSFSQERLWFLEQLRPGSAAYNIPAALRLTGALDPAVLAACFGEIVRRHAVLRTTFSTADGEARQRLAPAAGGHLPVVDLAALPEEARRREVLRRASGAAAAPFDLAAGLLLRTVLLRLAADEHLLLLTLHHIAADGWSVGILAREVAALYEAFAAGRPSPLPELPVQYVDFAVWQRRRLSGEALAGALRFWTDRLRGIPPELALPTDRLRTAVTGERGASRRLRLPAAVAAGVRALARGAEATPFMVLLAAFAALLSRLCGQTGVTLGAPVAGRGRAEVEGLIGFFVNTLVLRTDVADDPSFADLLARTRRHALEAFAHQELPFEKLIEHLQPERTPGRNPLFQAAFAWQAAPLEPLRLPGLAVDLLPLDTGTAKFDLTLALAAEGDEFAGELSFNAELLDGTTVERWARHFERLLSAAAAAPEKRIAELPLLGDAERQAILREWNAASLSHPDAPDLLSLIAAAVRRSPEAVAGTLGGDSLSYRELHRQADRLAHRLRRLGVGPEVVVGVCLERSLATLVALVAVLRSGGAYLPLDPDHPAERLSEQLRDSGAAVLITRTEWLARCGEGAPRAVLLDGGDEPPAAEPAAGFLPAPPDPASLAYVIYTSGSTGRPKGVGVTHAGLNRRMAWWRERFAMTAADRATLLAAPGFDASVLEIWPALTAGASLHVAPAEVRSAPRALLRWLAERRVTLTFLPTPLTDEVLAEAALDAEALHRLGLRALTTGGDRLRRRPPAVAGFELVNLYGPTEITVMATAGRVEAAALESGAPAIGRPIPEAAVYLVDSGLEPVPAGVRGEVLLGGPGVARGYLGRPELTAERFLPDPFSGEPGARLYRTGDLARWLPDGQLDFLGRGDSQVKIRGFRIELAEIEAALTRQPEVREAVVLALGDGGEKRLAAWVVPAGPVPAAGALQAALRRSLPDFMVPAAWEFLERLPSTPSGKVDRQALARLAAARGASSPAWVEPRTPAEELLAGLWEELLGHQRVGAHDDFFALGGHSLLATRMLARVRAAFGVDLPVRRLFEAPTLAALAAAITEAGAGTSPPSVPRQPRLPEEDLPLSFAQERLWFLDSLDPGAATYNIPGAVELAGHLDVAALGSALRAVVDRHEVLRTVFRVVDGEPRQRILPVLAVELPVLDLTALPPALRLAAAERWAAEHSRHRFDLARGPLLDAALLRLAPDRHRLFVVFHHAVCDGWSVALFVREIGTLYAAHKAGLPSPLPELPIQYADFAAWQRAGAAASRAAELAYWLDRLSGEIPLELPADRSRPAVQTYRGGREMRVLPPLLAGRLTAFGRAHGATLFMVLLAAIEALLHRHSGQDDLLIGAPVAGRRAVETESLIGCFLNSLALRTDLSGGPGFRALVARVREVTLGAYSHQDVPFEAVLAALPVPRDLSRNPLFQVMVNLLNQPPAEMRLPELTIESLAVPAPPSKLDMTFYAGESGEGLRIDLVYNADLFDAARMEEVLAQLAVFLDQALERPDEPVGSLSLITAAARAVLPDPIAPLPAAGAVPVHERFTELARRHPERPAVTDGDGVWSYGDLLTTADRLAAWLLSRGVDPSDRVAVFAHRSSPLALALLGILKAGAVFTVLDPAYPAARLIAVLTAAAPRGFLHLEAAGALPAEVEDWLRDAGCPRLALPRGRAQVLGLLAGLPDSAPALAADPDGPAYVTFTSGSTGVPKGVLGSHRPLAHFIAWHAGRFGLAADDCFSLLSGLAHDPLLRDLFTPLCLGARLAIPAAEDLTLADRFTGWMRREGVTVAHLTPALSEVLTEATGVSLAALRYVFFGGDVLSRRAVERLRGLAPGCACVNYYGATETPQGMGCHEVSPSDRERIPLGRGIDGVQLLVLNPAGQLAGVGELGEICIRTPYLSLGYLHDEELTRQRFVTNPFTGSPADRLYRTGDLGRYLPDGAVDLQGRRDSQVKVRGFRVELGEIESALAGHAAVAQAAVAAWPGPGGQLRLVAYVVAREGTAPEPSELSRYLRSRLPDYMLPSGWAFLGALPLTPNGKVDRRALPAPAADPEPARHRQAPETELEREIAAVWQAVLEVEGVGVHDDFFALGGHSLLATRLLSRLQRVLGVALPLRALFERPTVHGLAALVSSSRRQDAAAEAPPLVAVPRDRDLPLSFAQQRLWFLDQWAPQSGWYNLPSVLRLEGPVERQALTRSLDEIVRRHEVLRSAVEVVDGQPVQRIAPGVPGLLRLIDLSGLPAPEREAEATRRITAAVRRPFALSRAPLLRGVLLRLAAEVHTLVVVAHHIAGDAWSMGLFVRELSVLYRAFLDGAPSPLPELPLQYADYAVWQRSWLRGEPLQRLLAGWRSLLPGAPAALELPTDRPRPPVQSFRGANLPFQLGAAAAAGLRALCSAERTTLFMTLLAGFQTLLFRYSGQESLVVGSPIAGRNRDELEGLIGMFVNTLPLPADLSRRPTFRELLARTREVALTAYAFQDLPFEKLVEALQPARDLSRPPIFQTMLILQNAPAERLTLPGLTLSPVALSGNTARFELLLSLAETAGGIEGFLEHNADLFDRATCERLLAHLANLLGAAAAAPERRIGEIPLLLERESDQILREWNDTARPAGAGELHRMIAGQAARMPERVAVVAGGETLTYGELETRANRLARYLRRWVRPEARVGIYLERSLDLPVALLAALKAGGAYVPLDPSYPRERLAFMLDDAGVSVVVTTAGLRSSLPGHRADTVLLDAEAARIAAQDAADPGAPVTPGSLAYVLYTSGSTGRPKGVQVPHGALTNFLLSMRGRPGMGAGDVLAAVTSLSFDIAALELYLPLLVGGRVAIASREEAQDGLRLQALLASSGATLMQATPSTWRLLIESGWQGDRRLKALCGGEALPQELADRILERAGELWNLYGPTETTVWSTVEAVVPGRRLSIGQPIANTRVYVVDPEGQPVPAGVRGELLVGGSGVVRGYLGRPDLTAERFVPDPFGPPGCRLYRTGDLVRFRPDGALEFLGRLDQQVKVRGFRVELGEIEAALALHPAVAQAVAVLADGNGRAEPLLTACVVPAAGLPVTAAELREHLRSRLPDYMVPGGWAFVPDFPLTPNGKIDRKALAAAQRREAAPAAYVPPRSGLESTIAGLWQELLEVEQVGRRDNFFDLGGHSLLMARVQSRLREMLGREVRMVDLFSHATVESLSRHLALGDLQEQGREPAARQAVRVEQGKDRLRQLRERKKVLV